MNKYVNESCLCITGPSFQPLFSDFFFGNESKKKEAYAVTTKERKMLNSWNSN